MNPKEKDKTIQGTTLRSWVTVLRRMGMTDQAIALKLKVSLRAVELAGK
jgi:DNA-binding NarL/FixJ family response regulator